MDYQILIGIKRSLNEIVTVLMWLLCFSVCPVADSFDHKKFFELVGLKSKSADDVKKVFTVLDADNSGFIEEEELK